MSDKKITKEYEFFLNEEEAVVYKLLLDELGIKYDTYKQNGSSKLTYFKFILNGDITTTPDRYFFDIFRYFILWNEEYYTDSALSPVPDFIIQNS